MRLTFFKKDHVHNFRTWQDTEKGKIMHHIWNDRIVGYYVRQERRCIECGKAELNLIQVRADDYKTLKPYDYNDEFNKIVRNL